MYEAEDELKKNLIIASLLNGKGPTGVEMHFHNLISEARANGIDGLLITPFSTERMARRLGNLVTRALKLCSREQAEIFSRWAAGKLIEKNLHEALSNHAGTAQALTIYAQDPVSAKTALKVRKTKNCRVVTVIHYNFSEANEFVLKGHARKDGPLWRSAMSIERQTLPQVDQIIFVSEFMRNAVAERLPEISAVPQSVLPNFIRDPDSSGSRPAIQADMIAIGTLEPRKNQAFLLRVLAAASARGYRYTLTVAGDGPDRPRLEALTRELQLTEQVRFAGFQKNAALLIPQHRILVHAALIESFGIAIVEALAAGKPILAGAVGGIPEIYRDAVEGYHWRLDDVSGAADLLIHLLSDANAYQRFSQAALLRYQTKFDRPLLVKRWLAALFKQQLGPYAPALDCGAAGRSAAMVQSEALR